jgi:hypothetical protein
MADFWRDLLSRLPGGCHVITGLRDLSGMPERDVPLELAGIRDNHSID